MRGLEMTKREKCPYCSKFAYRKYSGLYDGGKKITPDYGKCDNCGFAYEEHIKYSLENQVINYRHKYRRLK